MELLHYYLQLGWKPEEFINQDYSSWLFCKASFEVAMEDKQAQLTGR